MKLADAWGHYYDHTGKASDVTRQLAFAGIAIVWIFKIESGGKIGLAPLLIAAMIAIVVGLTCDLAQYVSLALRWYLFTKEEEKNHPDPNREFSAPDNINRPGEVLFYVKIAFIVIAYILLAAHLWKRVSTGSLPQPPPPAVSVSSTLARPNLPASLAPIVQPYTAGTER